MKKLWIVVLLIAVAVNANAQRFFPDGIALSNEYVRQQGLLDLAAWSEGAVTGETVRGLGVSAGQLAGMNPETGEAIADPNNLLPLAARSLSVVEPLMGDGSGLTNLDATGLSSGVLPAERLSGTYDITATNAQDALKLNGEDASFYLNANNLNAGTVADARLSAGLQALAANDGGALTNLDAGAVTSGTLPTERLSGIYDITATNAQDALKLNGQEASYYLNADNLVSGVLGVERLSGTYDITATNAQDATMLDGQDASFYLNANNLNAGTVADALLSAGLQALAVNDGGALTNLDAGVLASGILPVERLSGLYDISATNADNAARLGDVAATNYARTDIAETFETNVFFIGRVGIRTNNPACALDVNGAINCSSVTIGGTPVSTSTDTYWSVSSGGGGKIQYGGGNVGVGAENPHASALLEVAATDKGMLIPRMTRDQRDAIGTPATGLLIYQTDNTPGFYFYDGAQWSSISAGAGAVTAVTASGPLASSGGTTPNLSIALASSSQTGALKSVDWTTFNAKVPTNRTITTTAPLAGGGALAANLTISMPAAAAATNGYLSSADWVTFTAKVPTNRSITASTGLTGGGTLSADRTLALTGQALALHNLTAAGLVTRTGAAAITSRVIAVSGNGIAVANGDGVSGNPSLSLSIGTGSTQVAAGNHTHADYSTPPGVIHAYGGASAPSGYLLCNGAAVSRSTYADLFSAIGTNYGIGDGSTTFNVPNLQGRVPVGYSSADAEFNVRGESGGAKTHTLASNEIPAHVHLVDPPDSTTTTNGSHTHSYNDRYRGTTISDDASDRNVASDALNDAARTTGSGGSHAHTLDIPAFNSGSSGGGAAHNNLQPYLVVNYIIKH